MLVAIFIILIATSLSLAAFAALGITVIEAILLGLGIFAVLGLLNEMLSRRAQMRGLEKNIEDLTRLIARENEAQNALEERIKLINALEAGPRLDGLEADQQVFGTVVRQVAESVKELEENIAFASKNAGGSDAEPDAAAEEIEIPIKKAKAPETPFIPPHMLLDAIHQGQIEPLASDLVTLPQRKLFAHRLLPQLLLDDEENVGPDQFLQYHDETEIIASVDFAMIRRALEHLRRVREDQTPVKMLVPLAVDKLEIKDFYNEFMSFLASNAAFAPYVVFEADFELFDNANKEQRRLLESIVAMGYRICLVGLEHLRFDFKDMMDRGVRYLSVSAKELLSTPAMADIHVNDLTDYLARFDMDLLVSEVTQEDQILELLELEVKFAGGDYINAPKLLKTLDE